VIVGVFTVVAVLAAFAFVYWTAALGDRGETSMLRVRIPGSASGLGRGSAVLFNGVKVGDVQRVYIDVQNPSAAIADTLVDRLTPITKSTQADIGLAGLTGQANIELKGGDPKEANLLEEAEDQGTIAEITANPSAVTNLLQTAQTIFTRADNVLDQLEGFVKDVRGPLTSTVDNVQKFSESLASNADGVDKFLESVSSLSTQFQNVSGKIGSTLDAVEELLRSVDREKISTIVSNVDAFTKRLTESSGQFDGIVKQVNTAVTSFSELAKSAQGTLAKVDGVLGAVDADRVRTAIGNISDASATAKTALADIADASGNAKRAMSDIVKVTDKVGQRAPDIDQIIADAQQLAGRLNAASVRVDGILQKVDTLLGSGQAEGLVSDATATLKSFKQVADTLNSRLAGILDGLARFSGPGLQNVNSLVTDTRRSVDRIERAVTDLERNPQRIITGGDGTVRQYDGRTRR
ncbi:MAG: MCE family protein, partial [Rhizobiaceae bacterium]|nr:MCE family protein [Rhizobiaceae bacterium]